MTDFPDGIVIEARKAGLKQAKRKAADGSWFDVHDITFEIHPNDTNSPLSNMPLGTRVALVVTQLVEGQTEITIGDDAPDVTVSSQTGGNPILPVSDWREELEAADKRVIKRAGIMPNQPAFQAFLASHPVTRDRWVRLCEDSPNTAPVELAEQFVRNYCQVKSRADIRVGQISGVRLEELWTTYQASEHGQLPEQMESVRR